MYLSPTNLQQAQFRRTIWSAVVPVGVTKEDILKPEYWAHVASKLLPRSRVEVHAEDNSFYAELIVLNSGKLWAAMQVLTYVEFSAAEATESKTQEKTEGFSIAFHGPQAKWSVVRKADKTVIHKGCETKDEARKWLDENVNIIA